MAAKFTQGLLREEAILAQLNIRPGQTVLDAGCGDGYMAKRFAKLAGDAGVVYAMDRDSSLIEGLRREVSQRTIVPLIGDITRRTELAAGSVDLIYLSAVFHIFTPSQVAGFAAEVRRLLKPGGRLAVVNINKEETPFGPPIAQRSSPDELRRRLSLLPAGLVEAGEHFYMQLFEMPEESSQAYGA
jgi:ubiquinone/menaquinone biosynthesis C-methylase UbiE